MSPLLDFLRARLAEDERVALAATPGPWRSAEHYDTGRYVDAPSRNVACESSDGDVSIADGDHIARHDPARVLAEVEAKRRIIDLHIGEDYETDGGVFRDQCTVCGETMSCETLRLLALPYVQHDDYLPEWAL